MRGFIIGLVIVSVIPTRALATDWQGHEATEDGVLHVYNPSEPADGETTLELEELFRLGGAEGEEIFGAVSKIVLDDAGNCYLLDTQLNEIQVFDPQGAWLRTIGREGEAPGEFRMAFMMLPLPDHRLGVVQGFPLRVAVLSLDGEPMDDLPLPESEGGGFMSIGSAESAGDHLVLDLISSSFEQGAIKMTHRTVSADLNGNELYTFAEKESEQQMSHIVVGRAEDGINGQWRLGPNGRLYAKPLYHEYRIEVYDLDGTLERVIHRDYESMAMSEEDEENLRRGVTFTVGMKLEVEVDADPWHRDISSVEVRENGEIWIVSSRGGKAREAGGFGFFDVFDSEGHFARRVRLSTDFDAKQDGAVIVGDRLFVLRNQVGSMRSLSAGFGMSSASDDEQAADDEDIFFEVICYRLPYVTGG